ncbi:MAG: hypothetical protein R3191_00620 [Anaerolineales bacterium]|nr:hypothetical protein [Anaerolineales bacterium]
MGSLLDLIRRLFGSPSEQNASRRPQPSTASNQRSQAAPTRRSAAPTRRAPTHTPATSSNQAEQSVDPKAKTLLTRRPREEADGDQDADEYLERIDKKINKLAEEFAEGTVNREQFQQLFEHYQRERTAIQNWKDSAEARGDWQDISSEGKSIVIRSKHTAKVLGYAIYANESGMPLTTIGDFDIDPDLAVPMLSSYRSATKEIFGGEMRSTEIEGGKWLCFVPGSSTTMLALFTREPAARQLKIMEDLHRLFEKANRRHLAEAPIDPQTLAFPHASYLGRLQ